MAIHLWHLKVCENYARTEAGKHAQGIQPIVCRFHFEAIFLEQSANGMTYEHRVIDHERTSDCEATQHRRTNLPLLLSAEMVVSFSCPWAVQPRDRLEISR